MILKEFNNHGQKLPFMDLLGVLLFVLTLLVIFLNYLNICTMFTLNNDILKAYLALSQPELDMLKQGCRAFIKLLNDKDFQGLNDISIKEKLSLPSHPKPTERGRNQPLKQYKQIETPLETRLYKLVGLFIIASVMFFLVPIGFQKHYSVLMNQLTEQFSIITQLEMSYSFSHNILKQEVISELPILNDTNITNALNSNIKHLQELIDKLSDSEQKMKSSMLEKHSQAFDDVLHKGYCNILDMPLRNKCEEFQDGILNSGLKSALDHNTQNLIRITKLYISEIQEKLNKNALEPSSDKSISPSSDENNITNSRIMLIKGLQQSNIERFRRFYLRKGLERLRSVFPRSFRTIFRNASAIILAYEGAMILIWAILSFLLYVKVIRPLYSILAKRKKLVRLIPFPILIGMKGELIEFVANYCDLQTHALRKKEEEQFYQYR